MKNSEPLHITYTHDIFSGVNFLELFRILYLVFGGLGWL